MEAVATKEVVITLVLTPGEAAMLAGLVQNPVCDPSEEPEDDANFRHRLFDTLSKALHSEIEN